MSSELQERLRQLPSVDELLRHPALASLASAGSRPLVVEAARAILSAIREEIRAGAPDPTIEAIAQRVAERFLQRQRSSLRPVLNASGVIINTNLGRAPLSQESLQAIAAVAQGYSNLEYNLEAGERGSRHTHVRAALRELTGAEDALVTNNNAAAVLLVLSTLAAGREVIISRGQLVEIGGGFRVPDVMRQSGARLVEVGTTNRTRLRDYEEAITPETAILLSVHPSNFRITGFTESVPLGALAELAHRRGLLAIEDLGSGCLVESARFGLAHEPTPQESIAAGADVVCFSGDKLLGGPQAGIILGKSELIQRISKHPLMRAIRIDKLTLAALEATLRHYQAQEAPERIPIWRMIAASPEALARRARRWAQQLGEWGIQAEIIEGQSTIGGGSLPGETLQTTLLALSETEISRQQKSVKKDAHSGINGHQETSAGHPPSPKHSALDTLAARLRAGNPPVVARILRDHLLLDPRTVLPEQDSALLEALKAAICA
ncbi:MAG TPA: L-seryl-tRNA(Sec) selenium transferase [Ktedonobacterales bacterium]|nr:L-seryl-tRNA(Sec) selenium transferase [Ktedonobacterales bacterium]